ncbi:uncharacterized protein LOC124466058 [Hypomesus transpacificus]|uniref:uncharacterized protein LOC124466058 n=1 Tax=Hypomesus transpacificus TaxID=137520 RepID=UPI001F076154|nr:uncharacterized protein LOC124466058 [Hypomesus transpacificus]
MARNMGCSSSYLYKKSILLGISLRHRFRTIGDDELEQHISRLHQQCPQSGITMMQGYLRAEGITVQRRRVREMLTRVDPAAAAQRWSNVVARRSYHVPFPNSLWHIDGHMRLIRWGFVTHAGIDGRSRVITFLRCSTNNTATTVLSHFVRATCQYGVPSRVRSDCGGENTLVALLMTLLNGQGRGSHITGRSVHNQRVERHWRDVFIQVIHSFYNLFYSFEEDLILDPNDHIHRFSLHKTYLPEIQNRLDCFRVAWNSHSLRTEHNCTPNQIWMDGMLGNIHQNATAVQRVFGEDPYTEESLETMLGRHDIQLPRLQAEADNDDLDRAVIVEPPPVALTPEQEQALQDALTGITDLKPRYQSCCRVLSEFGIGQ